MILAFPSIIDDVCNFVNKRLELLNKLWYFSDLFLVIVILESLSSRLKLSGYDLSHAHTFFLQEMFYANEYMKDHISELRRKIYIYD